MTDYNIWKMIDIYSWGLAEVKNLLVSSGYELDDVIDAKFDTIVNHTAVFSISYDDRYGESGTGRLYVKPDSQGYLKVEF